MTTSRSRTISFLVSTVFLACILSLSIMKTIDFDAWIHLTFGKVIWQTRGLPATEPFIPSMAGKPFSYSSWLFGCLYYAAYQLFDTYGVVLLKAASVVTIFAILLKDSLIPCRNRLLAASVLIVVAVLMRPRFVERPDTFLLIFLPYSIMALNAYLIQGNRRYLYALPLVHLLWANSHSSINLMFVPFVAVFLGGALGSFLSGKGIDTMAKLDMRQARFIAVILAASIVGALVSPYGITQFTFAAQFLKMDVLKQEITELQPTVWMEGFRWFYILMALTAASFVAAWRRLSLVDLARIVPFIYLGLMSRRFVYISAVVAAPILIRNVSLALERLPEPSARLRSCAGFAALAWVLACTGLSFAQVGPFQARSCMPGFGFVLSLEPEGALSYMDRRHITGKVFPAFQWGQYIEWRDAPRRIPFIDGRAYIAPELMEQVFSEIDLDRLAEQYGIDAFLLTYPKVSTEGVTERDLGFSAPNWVLVYWDDNALLYLKRGGRYDSIVASDEYRAAKPANGLKALEAIAKDPRQGGQLLQELRRNVAETGSSLGMLMLGQAYIATGRYQEAIAQLSRITDERLQRNVYGSLGRCYQELGNGVQALKWYQESLQQQETADLQQRVGTLLLAKGDAAAAVQHLKRAVELNPELYDAYGSLAEAYRKTGKEQEAAEALKTVQGSQLAKEYFSAGVRAYTEGRVPDAAAAFQRAISANPRVAMPYVNLGFTQIDMNQIPQAFGSFQQALKLEPECALAHYGEAMIYKARGDKVAANEHWKRYLQIEPSGYYSRVAKKELEGG